jgi:hypothetical protein
MSPQKLYCHQYHNIIKFGFKRILKGKLSRITLQKGKFSKTEKKKANSQDQQRKGSQAQHCKRRALKNKNALCIFFLMKTLQKTSFEKNNAKAKLSRTTQQKVPSQEQE